jgi:hypothetical protein
MSAEWTSRARPHAGHHNRGVGQSWGGQIGRYTFQPGWKWSECIKPVVGTDSCQTEHVGYVVAGHLHVTHDAKPG